MLHFWYHNRKSLGRFYLLPSTRLKCPTVVLKVVVAAVVANTETGIEAEVIVETIEVLAEDDTTGMTLAGEIVVLVDLNGKNKLRKFYFAWP